MFVGFVTNIRYGQHDLAMNRKRSNWADQVDITNLKKIEMAPG